MILQSLPNASLLLARILLLPRAQWELDADTSECGGCGVRFGFFVRKHHCRVCGAIYCHGCTNEALLLAKRCCLKCRQVIQRHANKLAKDKCGPNWFEMARAVAERRCTRGNRWKDRWKPLAERRFTLANRCKPPAERRRALANSARCLRPSQHSLPTTCSVPLIGASSQTNALTSPTSDLAHTNTKAPVMGMSAEPHPGHVGITPTINPARRPLHSHGMLAEQLLRIAGGVEARSVAKRRRVELVNRVDETQRVTCSSGIPESNTHSTDKIHSPPPLPFAACRPHALHSPYGGRPLCCSKSPLLLCAAHPSVSRARSMAQLHRFRLTTRKHSSTHEELMDHRLMQCYRSRRIALLRNAMLRKGHYKKMRQRSPADMSKVCSLASIPEQRCVRIEQIPLRLVCAPSGLTPDTTRI